MHKKGFRSISCSAVEIKKFELVHPVFVFDRRSRKLTKHMANEVETSTDNDSFHLFILVIGF